jgi:hypothetical protein
MHERRTKKGRRAVMVYDDTYTLLRKFQGFVQMREGRSYTLDEIIRALLRYVERLGGSFEVEVNQKSS